MSDIKMQISTAREELNRLPERLQKKNATIEVTRRGKSVMAILPWEAYEALTETLEIVGDSKFMEQLRESIKEMEAGQLIPWEQAKEEL